VASERRTCAKKGCPTKFSRPLGSRRVYCETCSPPRKPPVSERPEAPPVPLHQGPGPLEVAAQAALTAAGRTDTFAGALWLRLAREADQAPGPKVAVLVTAVLKARTEALEGWKPPRADAVDELARARTRKAESA